MAAALAALPAGGGTAVAQTWLYTGTDYGIGANWSTGVTPGAGQTATLNAAGANQPVVGGNFTIGTVDLSAGSLTLNTGQTLTVQTAANVTSASILGGGTLSLNSGATLTTAQVSTVAAAVAGAGNLSVTTDLTVTGTNTYSGTTTVNLGAALRVGTGGTTGTIGTGAVTLGNASELRLNRSDTITLSNAISGTGMVRSVAGTTILTGTNSYGQTTFLGGTIQVGAGGTTGTLGSGNVVTTNGTLAFNRSDSMTVANAITGTGVVNQIGGGTTSLTGANTYTGTTTINAGILQIGSAGTSGTLGTGAVTVGSGATLQFNRSDSVTVANVISSLGNLVKTTAGGTGSVLTLTGANSYDGTTTINGGTLQVGAGGTAGTLGNGTVTVASGATLQFNRSDNIAVANLIAGSGALTKSGAGTTSLTTDNTYSGTTTISAGTLGIGDGGTAGSLGTGSVVNNATLGFNRTDDITVSNVISGTGGITQDGTGTTSLTGSNSYSGTTTITGGTLSVGTGGTAGTLGTGGVSVGSGTIQFNRSDTITIANAISGLGTVQKAGTGTTILTGANSYGQTTISAGTLQVGAGGTAGALGTGNIVTSSGATLVLNRSDAITVSGLISGGGEVRQAGAGTTSLTGTNTYSGTTTISAGTLNVGAGGTTGTLGDGTGAVVNNASLILARTNDMTVSNAISGSGSLTKLNGGASIVLTLTGANSYTGTTAIDAGILQVGNAGTAGTLGTGAVTVATGTTLRFNRSDDITVANDISGAGALVKTTAGTNTILTLTGSNSYSGSTTIGEGTLQVGNGGSTGTLGTGIVDTTGGTLRFNRSGTLTVSAGISGTGSVVQAGSGTTILASGTSYSGGTTISAGTLQMGSGGTIGTLGSGAVSVALGAALAFNRSDVSTFANVISGAGAVNQVGTGTIRLTGANAYSGGTTINSGGTLQVGVGGPSSTTGSVGTGAVVNNGTLNFERSDGLTIANDISGSGTLNIRNSSTYILTGTNTLSGLTAIVSTATLRVGAGGTAGSLGTSRVILSGALILDRSDALTVSGAISGAGAVTQAGAGTTSLTGANSNTGTTTISAGTLSVGAGGTTGSLGTGGVTNNATLQFNRSDSMTVANAISGTGAVTQVGSGTTTLTGTNTYSGATTVSAGRLAVNGTIASNVSVGAGGNLGGSGTITGTVANSGMLAPGNSIGTLSVVGSYTQAAGSTYQVEVNAAGQADRINVSGAPGTATINGGTVQVVAAAGAYARNTIYTIVNATGGVTGTYAGVTSNFAFLTPSLSYDANNVYLGLALNSGAFTAGGLTPNQRAVGTALDRTFQNATGDFATVVNTMAMLDTAQGPAALDAISGQQYSGFATANLASGLLFMNTVGQQMAVARGNGGAGNRVALAQACEVACDGDGENAAPGPWSLWGSALGGAGSVAGNGNASTLTYNAGGFATGIDHRFGPNLLAGIALGYVSGNQWVSNFNSRGTSDSYQAALYVSFTRGALYLDAQAGFAYNDNQLTRMISIPGLQPRTAMGRTGSGQLLGQAEAGYRVDLHRATASSATLTPFVRMQGANITQAGFSESGANSLNLNVVQQQTQSLRSTIGAELSGAIDAPWREKLALQLRLGWIHEYADTARPVTASFAGAPAVAFMVVGAAPPRDSAVLGFAASTALGDRTSLYLRYDGEFGTGIDSHALSAGFRLTW